MFFEIFFIESYYFINILTRFYKPQLFLYKNIAYFNLTIMIVFDKCALASIITIKYASGTPVSDQQSKQKSSEIISFS